MALHRAELIPSALLIAQAIVEHLTPSEVVISGAGLREGLLYRRLYEAGPPSAEELLAQSCRSLLFQLDETVDETQLSLSLSLLAAMAPLLPQADASHLGEAAAVLRGIGRRVNFYDRHTHTFAIVVGARLFGLSHREQVLLAATASYEGPRHLRELLAPYQGLLGRGDIILAQRLGLAVAYAETLSRSVPGEKAEIAASITPSLITLGIGGITPPPQLPFSELDRLAGQFAKVYGRKLVVRYN
jgi:exopolyphosphatase/guanosine-5'-triphosphate,3'-diphosphate pyrophosphatase